MRSISYLDFDLEIQPVENGYRARVLNSPSGEGAGVFELPFTDLELENFLLRVGRTRRGVRHLGSSEELAAKEFGGRLFDAVFGGEVGACFRSSLDEAERNDSGLRIRLRLRDAPDLVDLPWEYLYSASTNLFLTLSVRTPVVRYLDLPGRTQPLAVGPPLKLLAMISSPTDYPGLQVEEEWTQLSEALADLVERGMIELERLEHATLAVLQQRLRQDDYHIFHFVGHGGIDSAAGDGVLVLEDENGRGRPVTGEYLGTLFRDHRSLRMVVLNACEGARTSLTDPFSGTAQSLVQQGVPAVVAMQFEITDQAAITLAHEFYEAIADGYPVDAALGEARKAILADNNDIEWGTPVLYMRSPDGRIFELERAPEPPPALRTQRAIEPPDAAASELREGLTTRAWSKVRQFASRRAVVVGAIVSLLVISLVAIYQGTGDPEPPDPTQLFPLTEVQARQTAENLTREIIAAARRRDVDALTSAAGFPFLYDRELLATSDELAQAYRDHRSDEPETVDMPDPDRIESYTVAEYRALYPGSRSGEELGLQSEDIVVVLFYGDEGTSLFFFKRVNGTIVHVGSSG